MPDCDSLGSSQRFAGRMLLVLGIALGGVPVAAQVARLLGPELDVVVARKIGVPFQPELALGAVTADGSRFTNLALVRYLKLSTRLLRVQADEQRAAARLSGLRNLRPRARQLVFRWRAVGGARHESKNGMNPRESPIPGAPDRTLLHACE